MPFSNGQQITDLGQQHVRNTPAEPYVPLATDVYINGGVHTFDGVRWMTITANQPDDVFINGIRHSKEGVMRFLLTPPGTYFNNAGGFMTDVDGRLIIQGSVTNPPGYVRGIGIHDTDEYSVLVV